MQKNNNEKKTAANPRAMQWCFTLNNPKQPIEFNELTMTYLVYGEEVGEEGTFHHQGFVVFKNRKTLTQLKELNNRAHWEVMKGTTSQASDYCKKEGKFYEFGEAPVDKHAKAGKQQQDKWRKISDYAKSGELDAIDAEYPKAFVGSYRNLKQLKVDYMRQTVDLEKPCGVWLYGDAGAGKSYKARKMFPEHYPKACNKWWDGYQQEDHVIIDDFDRNHAVLGHHLKIWSDRYSFLGETKGGTVVCRPKVVCVTSQYAIEDIFEDKETRDALKRRFSQQRVLRSEWDNPLAWKFKKQQEEAKKKQVEKLDEEIAKKHEKVDVSVYEKMPKRIQPPNVYFPDPILKFSGQKRTRKESNDSDVIIVGSGKVGTTSLAFVGNNNNNNNNDDDFIDDDDCDAMTEVLPEEETEYSGAMRRLKEYKGYVSDADYIYFSHLPLLKRPLRKLLRVPPVVSEMGYEQCYLCSGKRRKELLLFLAANEKACNSGTPSPAKDAMLKKAKDALARHDELRREERRKKAIEEYEKVKPFVVYSDEMPDREDAEDAPDSMDSPPASPDEGQEIPTQTMRKKSEEDLC